VRFSVRELRWVKNEGEKIQGRLRTINPHGTKPSSGENSEERRRRLDLQAKKKERKKASKGKKEQRGRGERPVKKKLTGPVPSGGTYC